MSSIRITVDGVKVDPVVATHLAREYRREHEGRLPTAADDIPSVLDSLTDSLRERYELNPARFTFYHPRWGRWFDREPPAGPGSPMFPPAGGPGILVPPIEPDSPSTPVAIDEPATAVLCAIAILSAFRARRSR